MTWGLIVEPRVLSRRRFRCTGICGGKLVAPTLPSWNRIDDWLRRVKDLASALGIPVSATQSGRFGPVQATLDQSPG